MFLKIKIWLKLYIMIAICECFPTDGCLKVLPCNVSILYIKI